MPNKEDKKKAIEARILGLYKLINSESHLLLDEFETVAVGIDDIGCSRRERDLLLERLQVAMTLICPRRKFPSKKQQYDFTLEVLEGFGHIHKRDSNLLTPAALVNIQQLIRTIDISQLSRSKLANLAKSLDLMGLDKEFVFATSEDAKNFLRAGLDSFNHVRYKGQGWIKMSPIF